VADQAISAITSADELLFVDGTDLQSNKVIRIQHVPKGLTSLAVADAGRTSIVGGHEGSVAIFDLRTQKTVAQFQTGTLTLSPGHLC
jgi:glucose dehydrogenase